MTTYTVRLIARDEVAEGTVAFHFDKPAGFILKPGHGLTSPVNGDLVKSVIETLSSPIFYVSGPPAMVQAMHATLADAGIDGDDVRSEEFYGY